MRKSIVWTRCWRAETLVSRFVRLAEQHRETLTFYIDGEAAEGLAGDTLLVAMLNQGNRLRYSEFGDGSRAGFCLMGACQDCWVWAESGDRLRSCTTPLSEGLRIRTQVQDQAWLTKTS